MQPKANGIRPLLLFLLEWVGFLILSTPFSGWAKSPVMMSGAVSFIALLFAGGLLILKLKLKSENMAYYSMWAVVVALAAWIGFSLPIVISLLFAIYFMWRMLNFLDGQTYELRWWLFFISVLLALVFRAAIKQPVIDGELIGLLAVQTCVSLTFEAYEEWRQAKRLTGTLSFLAGAAAMGLVAWFIKLIFPLIKWVLNEILAACLFVVMLLVKLLWQVMSKLLGPRMASHQEALTNLFKTFKKQPKKIDHQHVIHHGLNPDLLMFFVVIVIIGLTFFFFRKWQFTKGTSNKRPESLPWTDSKGNEENKSRLFSFLKAPKNPIRAHLFYLQKKLRKREEGRYKHETIGEWLNRITNDAVLQSSIQSTYEAIRYGSNQPVHLPENQVATFEMAIKQVEAKLLQDDHDKK
ncbi:MAG TPA: hypothetical protein VFH42_07580 [Sporolactobacillaceae bacterium]|nr:hypothetical protein [Sporolactobacillaceae bacterium]